MFLISDQNSFVNTVVIAEQYLHSAKAFSVSHTVPPVSKQ